jgi:hypothetical protein
MPYSNTVTVWKIVARPSSLPLLTEGTAYLPYSSLVSKSSTVEENTTLTQQNISHIIDLQNALIFIKKLHKFYNLYYFPEFLDDIN